MLLNAVKYSTAAAGTEGMALSWLCSWVLTWFPTLKMLILSASRDSRSAPAKHPEGDVAINPARRVEWRMGRISGEGMMC